MGIPGDKMMVEITVYNGANSDTTRHMMDKDVWNGLTDQQKLEIIKDVASGLNQR